MTFFLMILTAVTAWAGNTETNETIAERRYRDASDTQQTATNVNKLEANSVSMTGGWYVADANLEIGSRVSVTGNVKLILKDGVTLHIAKGITVEGDNSLTIYGQTDGTGVLTIDEVEDECAGIGAVYNSGNGGGTVTICGGVVNVAGGTAACDIGGLCNFFIGVTAPGGTINISGGQVTASGLFGFGGMNSTADNIGTVTLGYNRPTDFIKVATLSFTSSVTIAAGKKLTDGTNIYSGTLTTEQINAFENVTFRPSIPTDVTYLDMNGEEQENNNCTLLTGIEETLAAGWYVADGTVSYDHHVSVAGDVHIILKDGAVMNVGTEQSPINGYGIGDDSANHSISIYGQSTGADNGQLNIYSTKAAIWAFNGDVNCSSARITAMAPSAYTIWAINNDDSGTGHINLKNAKVNTTGRFGMFAMYGNITIDGSQLIATGKGESGSPGYGVFALETSTYGSTIGGAVNIIDSEVTVTGDDYAIQAKDVTISGGQVTATGKGEHGFGIYAKNNITLGWNNPNDFILVNSYGLKSSGKLAIAEGQTFIDEDDNTYSGTQSYLNPGFAIDGKKLYPNISQGVVTYLDMNGEEQERDIYTLLSGKETMLSAGWYVAEGTISYNHHVTAMGDVHIILKDGAVMNVGMEQSPVNDNGIGDDSANHSISIYGQSTGADNGQLNIYSTKAAIWAFNGDVNCSSARITAMSPEGYTIWAINNNQSGTGHINLKNAKVNTTGRFGMFAMHGDITIDGGQLSATGLNTGYGIFALEESTDGNTVGGAVNIIDAEVTVTGGDAIQANDVTISGGQLTATGTNHLGIFANNITLGWNNPTDFIFVNSYALRSSGKLAIAKGQAFTDEDGNIYCGTLNYVKSGFAIDGKKLIPFAVPYYLVGTMTETAWDIQPYYRLCVNPANTSEYMIHNVALANGTGIKVASSTDGENVQTWYPDGLGNEYNITAQALYDIYFRPDGQGGEGWYKNVIYVEKKTLGDVNGNGSIDIGDAVCIVNYLVNKPNSEFIPEAADLNGNNKIDIGDAVIIVNILVGKQLVID